MEAAGKRSDQIQICLVRVNRSGRRRRFARKSVIDSSQDMEDLSTGDIDDMRCADDLMLLFVGSLFFVEIVGHGLDEGPVRYEPLLKLLR